MRNLAIVVLGALVTTACSPRPLVFQPRPMREWPATLQSAKEAARAGRYATADSVLAQFGARYPQSYEAREAAYWRALYLVDPANPQTSPAAAARAINEYFAGGSTADAYDEASVLRRVVQHVDSLTQTLDQAHRVLAEVQDAAATPRPAQPAAAPATEQREARANRNLVEEVRRLRDELGKANQELERVRRRLSEQRP